MKRTYIVALLCILLLIGLAVYFLSRSQPQPTTTVKEESTPQGQVQVAVTPQPTDTPPQSNTPGPVKPDPLAIRAFANALMKPILFWGKVIDEKGSPIAGANVQWSANNNPDPYGSGTKGQTTSRPDGMFSVKSHGLGLYVQVSKDSYYRMPTEPGRTRGSDDSFSNAEKLGKTDSPMGTQNNPSLFVLRKMGEPVPLIRVTERPIHIPKNGTPVEVNLATGQTVPSGQGGLKVECWTEDQNKDAQGQYAWRCRISVPGGGLIERTDQFAFEAPADGYKPLVEFIPSPEKWSARVEQQYFVKLPGDRYARIDFRLRTGGQHYFVIESYLNPTPGNRNLEYDPNKTVGTEH